jgi:hypothetical protein
MTPCKLILSTVLFCWSFLLVSCGAKNNKDSKTVTHAADSLSEPITYTVALADVNGEGMRITYQFFDMKKSDTGAYKMTHIYMKLDGTEDTMTVSGTWKMLRSDTGDFVRVNSGRTVRRLQRKGKWNLLMNNTDSLAADTGTIILRCKVDNDPRNSTVHMFGKVRVNADKSALFIDETGDSIPVLKLSAFRQLLERNDSVNLESGVKGINLDGTIQLRVAMDGKSTQKSLIVERVGAVE